MITPTKPVITHLTVSPPAGPGGTLFSAETLVTGGPSVSLSYQWLLDGAAIEGATAASHFASDAGSLSVEVTARTADDFDVRVSDAAPVGPGTAPPDLVRVVVTPEAGQTGERFTALVDAAGVPRPALAFQWFLDGAPVPGATGPECRPAAAGDLAVLVTARNSAGLVQARSASAAVGEDPQAVIAPAIGPVVVSPPHGQVGEAFEGSAEIAGDPEPTVAYQWLLDGVPIPGAEAPRHTAGAAGSLSLHVTASSAAGTATRTSAPVTVDPASIAPAISGATLLPASGSVGDTFTAAAVVSGVPEPEVSYVWFLGGVEQAGASGPTFVPTAPGALTAEVRASNAAGSASQTTPPATVAPSASSPAIDDLVVAPGAGTVGDTFVVTGDITGVPVPNVTWQWHLNGALVVGATGTSWVATGPGVATVEVTATNIAGTAVATSLAAIVAMPQALPLVFQAGVFATAVFA